MDAYRAVFKEEAQELLVELEESLLELEEEPDNLDVVGRIFRAVHTLKGSGSMFCFTNLSEFAHQLESLLDLIRNGKLKVTHEILSVCLKCKDHLGSLVESDDEMSAEQEGRKAELLAGLMAAREEKKAPEPPQESPKPAPAKPEQPAEAKPASDAATAVYRIRYSPGPGALTEGSDPLSIVKDLKQLGSLKTTARTSGIPTLEELDPGDCHVAWTFILSTNRGQNAIEDIFLFASNKATVSIEVVDSADVPPDEPAPRVGDILRDRGDVSHQVLEEAIKERPPIGEHLQQLGVVTHEQVKEALVEQEAIKEHRDQRKTATSGSSLRVAADKLDSLVDMVGELVIAQARLTQISLDLGIAELVSIAEEVERLSSDLRDSTLGIRMLPIGTTFSKYKRLVRDLSLQLSKEAELITEGADTELDKTVLEQLGDPLVHLIRNSVDHGIETPEVRRKAGKPPMGKVWLKAFHGGGHVNINIEDDGAGLDPEKLRRKAVANGLIAKDAQLTDQELFQFIFAAGFSTAEKVSNVSGRGVGMDVVKRGIEALKGNVLIHSELGKKTVITIRLPLTLAIIEGLRVRVSDENYIIPLQNVEECLNLSTKDIEEAHGNHYAKVRGQLVPYLRIREWFDIPGGRPENEQLVITSMQGERFGFVVDFVVGQHQTVIKNLSAVYQHIRGLSGATILGDGTVSLILDTQGLAEAVKEAGNDAR